MAGLARVLEQLPADHPDRVEFAGILETMAAALIPLQGADGFWRSNLLDPDHYPNPEIPIISAAQLPVYHVQDYGAFPDDGIDDRVQIQRAIDTAGADGAGSIPARASSSKSLIDNEAARSVRTSLRGGTQRLRW